MFGNIEPQLQWEKMEGATTNNEVIPSSDQTWQRGTYRPVLHDLPVENGDFPLPCSDDQMVAKLLF